MPAGGDTWVSYWNLWWVGHAVLDRHADPNVCPLVHHPYGAPLYFHTLNLLPALVAIPISRTLGLAWAYNLLVWAGFALAGLAADRLARSELARLGVPEAVLGWAGLVGGCAFTFSAYAFMHLLGHLHLVMTFWIPWFALLFLRIARDEDSGSVPRTALVLAGTALTSWHYAFFEVLFAGVAVCWAAVARRGVSRRMLARTLGVGALSALLVSPVLVPMLALGPEAGRVADPRGDAARFSADLVGFVTPSSLHPVWGRLVGRFSERLAGGGNVTESTVYLGGVALVLAGVGFVPARRDRGAIAVRPDGGAACCSCSRAWRSGPRCAWAGRRSGCRCRRLSSPPFRSPTSRACRRGSSSLRCWRSACSRRTARLVCSSASRSAGAWRSGSVSSGSWSSTAWPCRFRPRAPTRPRRTDGSRHGAGPRRGRPPSSSCRFPTTRTSIASACCTRPSTGAPCSAARCRAGCRRCRSRRYRASRSSVRSRTGSTTSSGTTARRSRT